MKRLDILDRKKDILQWISENKTKSFMCKELSCKPETLNAYLKKMNIEYKGQPGFHKQSVENVKYKTVEEYLQSSHIKSSVLKKKLILEGYKKNFCEKCGISEWYGQQLTLELHHIDGNHYNNSLDNLQILCPNCHSLQSNDSGKATKREKNFCIDCGKVISKQAQRCKSCATKISQLSKRIVVKRPNREELKDLIRNKSFLELGKIFNVSDNAIRKWCKAENLPYKKKEINSFTDEEWRLI